MAPNQTKPTARGRPAGSSTRASKSKTKISRAQASTSSRAVATSSRAQQSEMDIDPFADSQPEQEDSTVEGRPEEVAMEDDGDEDDEDEPKNTIPPELLTRLLHTFFEKDGTRISKNANEAVAKYMDIFVREAIARAAVEKESGFLEVQDLEKVAPQLLFDV
jgi:centromere protein X